MDPLAQVALITGSISLATIVVTWLLKRRGDKEDAARIALAAQVQATKDTLESVESKVDGRLSESLDLTRRALEELTNLKTLITQDNSNETAKAQISAAAAAPNPTVPKGT